MTTKAKERWRPKNCHLRYSSFYDIQTQDEEDPDRLGLDLVDLLETDEVKLSNIKKIWCPCCMRIAIEPMEFPCGHTFCRSCIAHARSFLIQEYPTQIRDARTVLKCPISGCTKTILCLPIINGDFRFWKQHPRHSVSMNALYEQQC